jgi:hypothetical protein
MSKQLSKEDFAYLKQLEPSAMSEISLKITKPGNPVQLLSAARSEFIRSHGNVDGFYMNGVRTLFEHIARNVYNSGFTWSPYNLGQWIKFLGLTVGYEGGACMLSLEREGELPQSSKNSDFKGLGLGTPLGIYPYELFTVTSDFGPQLRAALGSFDYSPFRDRKIDW